ncbi:hypothetical protein HNQ94_001141 [Salirhabdus euzebyi]|uniref:Spore coat protein n=1 Tax=Salirhabdus euzebyi TaxID=394506 RepID=A0A841Q2J9_9BACI|nr:hypothetical protein [Salirhabdus euzebyi]MBB6452695.1 hypothetical protein [Salirhabdus euzebyi]
MNDELYQHETLEMHELITFKSLCLTKATIMQALVTDEKLKSLMQQDASMHDKHINVLKSHLS